LTFDFPSASIVIVSLFSQINSLWISIEF
jgi:hypothetical protein